MFTRTAVGAIAATGALLLGGLVTTTNTPAAAASASCPWLDTGRSPGVRASMLVDAMTTAEKLQMVHGQGVLHTPIENPALNAGDLAADPSGRGVGWVPGIPRLCVPPLYLSDGGQGIAISTHIVGATAYPAPIAQGAAFDRALSNRFGRVLADQVRGKGMNGLLGPDVNAGRVPGFSRNFEGIGGEDPYLAGSLASAMIRGAQSRHVIAVEKHYAGYDGGSQDAVIDQRTLMELYAKPFLMGVRAGVAAIMCSYNKINGRYACENPGSLSLLKHNLRFRGWVMSDWGATHSTVPAALAGLDQEMASDTYFGSALTSAVKAGTVPMHRLDDMVRRIVTPMFRFGLFEHPPTDPQPVVNTPASEALALQMSHEGTVLLKNAAHLLPLAPTVRSIAVIGVPASAVGAQVYYQSPTSPDSKVVPSNLSAPLDAITQRAQRIGARVVYDDGLVPQVAAAVAGTADVAVVFAATNEGELNGDRTDYALPLTQEQTIAAVAAANPRTVVVLNSGGPVTMPWLGGVGSVLEAWFPGEQDGNAIAGILFGDAEPGGRLPQTFPVRYGDEPPATPRYSERLNTGYRWFDAKHLRPLFPFGFGLGYTTFGYRGFTVPERATGRTPVRVTFTIRNTGDRAGSDVPQVYVGWPATARVREPVRQLRGFARVRLPAGASRRVTVTLDPLSFSYWKTSTGRWTLQPGCYPVHLARSSRDIVASARIALGGARC